MTQLELGKEYGLTKRVRFISMECNDLHKYIHVYYREELVAEDGTVIKEGERKVYEVLGEKFEEWDVLLGGKIRESILNRITDIYFPKEIEESEVTEEVEEVEAPEETIEETVEDITTEEDNENENLEIEN
jgi:hypothetical protein